MVASKALRFDIGNGQRAAMATYEMVEVLTEGKTTSVPLAPAHCHELLEWKDKLLPVFDLTAWTRAENGSSGMRYWAVVMWQSEPGSPIAHACLRLAGFPEMVVVEDNQVCDFPDERWHSIAASCYQDAGGLVPILHLPRMFRAAEQA